tara:strand:- start:415 stop:651 length:237 start_codon:yes stop_codon:yes gene_type:complete
LAGPNLTVIGDKSQDNCEVFQFQTAGLLSPNTCVLSRGLRSQLGRDVLKPKVWPAGSYFVLLNGAPKQESIPASGRNV